MSANEKDGAYPKSRQLLSLNEMYTFLFHKEVLEWILLTLPPGILCHLVWQIGIRSRDCQTLVASSESLANLLWPLAAQNNRSQLQLHHACGGTETHLWEQSGMRKQWDRNYPCYAQTLLTFLLNIPLAADLAHKSESNPNENHCFTWVYLSKTISLTCHCFCIEINR